MRLNSPNKWFILKLCDTVSIEELKQNFQWSFHY